MMKDQDVIIQEIAKAYGVVVLADEAQREDIKEKALLVMQVLLWVLEKHSDTGLDDLKNEIGGK